MELAIAYKEPTFPWAVWAATAWSFLALAVLKFGDRVLGTIEAYNDNATPLGALGATAVIFVPAVLLLASAWLDDGEQVWSILVALAWAAIWVALTILFDGGAVVTLVMLSIGRVLWKATRWDEDDEVWIASALCACIAISLVVGFFLLRSRETPMCWDGAAWTASAPSGAVDCRSDIIDSTEGARALVAVAAGLIGTLVMLRIWPEEEWLASDL